MQGPRVRNAGLHKPECGLPLVVGGDQRGWVVQQPHAPAHERVDLVQSRFNGVKGRGHIEAHQRDIAGPESATCVGRTEQLRSDPRVSHPSTRGKFDGNGFHATTATIPGPDPKVQFCSATKPRRIGTNWQVACGYAAQPPPLHAPSRGLDRDDVRPTRPIEPTTRRQQGDAIPPIETGWLPQTARRRYRVTFPPTRQVSESRSGRSAAPARNNRVPPTFPTCCNLHRGCLTRSRSDPFPSDSCSGTNGTIRAVPAATYRAATEAGLDLC